jgi:hypothetical protein
MMDTERVPVFMLPEKVWLKVREKGYCDKFTDEQFENAKKNNVVILRGKVSGISGLVDMWIDPRYPEMTCKFTVKYLGEPSKPGLKPWEQESEW